MCGDGSSFPLNAFVYFGCDVRAIEDVILAFLPADHVVRALLHHKLELHCGRAALRKHRLVGDTHNPIVSFTPGQLYSKMLYYKYEYLTL